LTALTKSWGLFSSAVTSAGKEIHESVVKPGMARAGQTLGELNDRSAAPARDGQGMQGGGRDPREIADRLSSQAKVTGGWLSSIAGEGWQNLNTLAKEKGGVDLSAKLGQLGLGSSTGAGRDGFPRGYEYEDVRHDGAAYHDDVRDGWDEWDAPAQKGTSKAPVKEQPKTDKAWDDEWKDF
jgi:ADP-ribosylation factor GTPase-activating protein 1